MQANTEKLKKEAEAKLKKEQSNLVQKMTKEEDEMKKQLMSQIKATETKLNQKLSQEEKSFEKVKSEK